MFLLGDLLSVLQGLLPASKTAPLRGPRFEEVAAAHLKEVYPGATILASVKFNQWEVDHLVILPSGDVIFFEAKASHAGLQKSSKQLENFKELVDGGFDVELKSFQEVHGTCSDLLETVRSAKKVRYCSECGTPVKKEDAVCRTCGATKVVPE